MDTINRDKLHEAWKLWDAQNLGYIPRTDNNNLMLQEWIRRMDNIIGPTKRDLGIR
jgi:hypothetical protein